MYLLFLFHVSLIDWMLWKTALSEPMQLVDIQFKNAVLLEFI